MKKNLIYGLAVIAAISMIASCQKEQGTVTPEEATVVNDGELVTITAAFPEKAFTKVDFEADSDDGDAILNLTWSAGDQIVVTDASNPSNTQTFTLKAGDEGNATAQFTGKALAAATSYNITFDGAGAFDYANQTQAGDATTDHLKYVATLSGVTSYSDFTFSEAWASANGGTYASSSVLRVSAELPGDAPFDDMANLKAVIIKASAPVFAGGKQIKVNITDASDDQGSIDYVTVYASLPAGDQVIPAGTELLVQFQMSDNEYDKYTAYRKFASDVTIMSSKVNVIGLKCDNILEFANASDTNIGESSNPYLIGDQHQMAKMKDETSHGSKVYFKLIDDVDMTGIDWTPLNTSNTYDEEVDFDGQNHTISNLSVAKTKSYPSLFGVAYGSYKDLTIDSATIDGGSNNIGVFAGYIGTVVSSVNRVATISGVTVSNSSVSGTAAKNTRNAGVFAGVVGGPGSSITNCHVTGSNSVEQTTTSYTGCSTGGFIGNVSVACTITGCTATADVDNAGSYYAAGFIGQIGAAVAANVSNCAFLGGTLTAGRNAVTNSPVAGFIGRITAKAGSSFTNCYVDGAVIVAATSGRCGGFVGDSGDRGTGDSQLNKFTSCYVINSSISAAQHVGGFAGVLYTKADKCYVDNVTITANNANNGGFVGYPQKALITNSYVTSSVTVNGGAYDCVGGFVGIGKGTNTITDCYEAATVTGTGTGVGAFMGYLDIAETSITKCIAWNGSLSFVGEVKDAVDDSTITGNYTGTSGTISEQATSLGWDGSVWDLTGSVPTLK